MHQSFRLFMASNVRPLLRMHCDGYDASRKRNGKAVFKTPVLRRSAAAEHSLQFVPGAVAGLTGHTLLPAD